MTALENGNAVKTMHMSAGQGNDYATGKCQASGDMCTPEGDFEIWLKYPSQNMSGTLTLSDGKKETWDVKNVGFVNYFSKSGCASIALPRRPHTLMRRFRPWVRTPPTVASASAGTWRNGSTTGAWMAPACTSSNKGQQN